MLLPIGTSISPRRTPYANYCLIIANVLFFVVSMRIVYDIQSGVRYLDLRPWAQNFMLWPQRPQIWQFVSYSFLHSGDHFYILHLLGNMYFLYLFGNPVNDKLGNVGYLCFYLAGAVFSALGHAMLHTNPVLGASGAVAAVTGAYLVLFPNTLITVFYMLFFIGTTELRALYFIAFKMIIWDNVIEPNLSASAVAYDAHLAGYGFGIIAVLGLLAFKLIDGDRQDLWSLIKQWNRRRLFRDAVAGGYNPYGPSQRVQKAPGGVTIFRGNAPPPTPAESEQITTLRAEIAECLRRHDPSTAAQAYLKLLDEDPAQVLPRQHQLDVANQLMAAGRWAPAASAYEKFLAHYGSHEHAEQVHLMLGLLYGRYLEEPKQAVSHLKTALEKLADPNQVKMCKDEIDRLESE
jgi:membrane associated rhomboid family serine protease